MQLTTTINFDANDELEIASILGCSVVDLNARLNQCLAASIKEYLTMIRGQKVFKRGTDMLEYRLFLLIESTFGGRIPDENTVSSLFQTSPTESRSLIRAVISKYQYQLKSYIEATLQSVLASASRDNGVGPYFVSINSHNVVSELNKILGEIDGSLTSVTKKKGSVSTYEITASSYTRLCTKLLVQPNP